MIHIADVHGHLQAESFGWKFKSPLKGSTWFGIGTPTHWVLQKETTMGHK